MEQLNFFFVWMHALVEDNKVIPVGNLNEIPIVQQNCYADHLLLFILFIFFSFFAIVVIVLPLNIFHVYLF